MRGQLPEIPVVVVSGSEDGSTINKCMDLGASGFIPKSAPLDVLSQAVEQVLLGEEWLPEGVDTALNPLAMKRRGWLKRLVR